MHSSLRFAPTPPLGVHKKKKRSHRHESTRDGTVRPLCSDNVDQGINRSGRSGSQKASNQVISCHGRSWGRVVQVNYQHVHDIICRGDTEAREEYHEKNGPERESMGKEEAIHSNSAACKHLADLVSEEQRKSK